MPSTQTHSLRVRLFEAPVGQQPSGKKILILKLDHIGDFVSALEAFRMMRRAFADCEISLICLPGVVDVARSVGYFDHVLGFSDELDSSAIGKAFKLDPADKVTQFARLLSGKYLLAVDFKHDPASRIWLDHVDCEYRAGFSAFTRTGLDIVLPAMEWDVPSISLAAKNLPPHASSRLNLLAGAVIDALIPMTPAALPFSPVDQVGEPVYTQLKAANGKLIGINVGAGSELRKWNPGYWENLVALIREKLAATVVFFGGPEDRAESVNLLSFLPSDAFIDATGAVSLARLPHYLSLLDAYVGCDTGVTHMAAALGIPTVNIFAGISNISVWRAKGPRVKTVYTEVVCAPCHLRFRKDCPNNNICMGAIMPDIVFTCLNQLLAEASAENSVA